MAVMLPLHATKIEETRHGEAEMSVGPWPSRDCHAPSVLAMTINILRARNDEKKWRSQ
jgi:hypothetical protein